MSVAVVDRNDKPIMGMQSAQLSICAQTMHIAVEQLCPCSSFLHAEKAEQGNNYFSENDGEARVSMSVTLSFLNFSSMRYSNSIVSDYAAHVHLASSRVPGSS